MNDNSFPLIKVLSFMNEIWFNIMILVLQIVQIGTKYDVVSISSSPEVYTDYEELLISLHQFTSF